MGEHLVQVCEVEPMLGQIAWPLQLVPDDHHALILHHQCGFCIYKKPRDAMKIPGRPVTLEKAACAKAKFHISLADPDPQEV